MSLLMPKKVKHRKSHKGRRRNIGRVSQSGSTIVFGSYGLKALEERWITSRQIEAGRRAIIRYLRKGGKLWIRIFPNHPVTTKGTEVPMGGGKGSVDHYVFRIKPGRIIFELDGINKAEALEALRKASDKLPIKTKIISREE